MEQRCLKFEGEIYTSVQEMASALLEQANERIIRIDLGEVPNQSAERLCIKLRLMHIERYKDEGLPKKTMEAIGSLWSHLYRLEHQEEYIHPYLLRIMERIHNDQKKI